MQRKSQRKSKAWSYFEEHQLPNGKKGTRCKKCGDDLSYTGSTSNMLGHLESKHPEILKEMEKTQEEEKLSQTQLSGPRSMFKLTPLPPATSNVITKALVKYITADMLPLRTVESENFLSLLRTLEPRYSPPSRTALTQTELPRYYTTQRSSQRAPCQRSEQRQELHIQL